MQGGRAAGRAIIVFIFADIIVKFWGIPAHSYVKTVKSMIFSANLPYGAGACFIQNGASSPKIPPAIDTPMI